MPEFKRHLYQVTRRGRPDAVLFQALEWSSTGAWIEARCEVTGEKQGDFVVTHPTNPLDF